MTAPTRPAHDRRLPVLFIGGFGRSGSTLLERVLGQVPGHVAVGELVHLPQRGLLDGDTCGCGKAFADCEFWAEVGQRAFGGWDRVDGWRELQLLVDRKRFIPLLLWPLGPIHRRSLRRHADRLSALYRAIADVAGASVVIDSSKHASTALVLHHVPGIRPVVIHLVRDSRGVAHSWSRQVVRPETADGRLMVRYGTWSAAQQYVQHNALFHLLGLVGTPRTFVRYEDFVDDPDGVVRQVLADAGLPAPDDTDLAFIADAGAGAQPDGQPVGQPVGRWAVDLEPDHSVAGNPMRFTAGPVELRRDDRWRRDMPPRQRRIVTAITAPLLRRYGYLGGRRTDSGR